MRCRCLTFFVAMQSLLVPTTSTMAMVTAISTVGVVATNPPSSSAGVSTPKVTPAPIVPTTGPAGLYEEQPLNLSPAKTASTEAPTAAAGTFQWQRLGLSLTLVVALIFVLRAVAGKMFPGIKTVGGSRAVRVLTRAPIAPRQQIILMQVGQRVIVVGDSAGQLSSLAQISDADEVAALLGQIANPVADPPERSFARLFGRARGEYEPAGENSLSSQSNRTIETERDSFDRVDERADSVEGASVGDRERAPDGLVETSTELSGLIERMRSITKAVRGR